MRSAIRWTVSALVVLHGLIHLLGDGVAWVLAAVLLVVAGVLLAASVRWWWMVGAVAAVVSQALIVSAWSEAKAGTVANGVLALAVWQGFAAQGPTSIRARYRQLASQQLAAAAAAGAPGRGPVVAAEDLRHLPPPVAAYVSACGAVGQPRVQGFRARIHGPWMPWTGEQVNTFGTHPSRVFFMDATMLGLPADVLHTYVGPAARMQVKPASVFTLIDAAGPEMTRAETVTLLNDLCVLAPAALVDAAIAWTPIDDHHARATFTNAGQTVSAELVFDDDHELVDFVSDDRLRASADGKSFTRQRWSTPLGGYRDFGTRRLSAAGHGRWHPDAPEPAFDYLEFHVDDITYVAGGGPAGAPEQH